MGNILIITNADIRLQSGDIILINRRANEIFNKFSVSTTCISIRKYDDKKKNNNDNIEGIQYISGFNINDIGKYIIKNKPQKIILYGVRVYKYINYIKNIAKGEVYNPEMILDVQGALEEDIEYESGFKYMKNYIKYTMKKQIMKYALNNVNGVFVVSDEMKEYCNKLTKNEKLKFYKVRCGINEVIKNEQRVLWRNEIREGWNIDDNTIVMAYSGYRSVWQNIDKIIEMFRLYDKVIENIMFVFFCNIDEEFLAKLKEKFPKGNYRIKFLSYDEYFKYLSACDVGILLRDYNETNRVAFPNKYSDYMNAGLLIAMNSALVEPYTILNKYSIDFIDTDDSINKNIDLIINRQNNVIAFYEKINNICKNELLYSTQIEKLNI